MRPKSRLVLILSLALFLPLVPAAVAQAAPDHNVTLTEESGPQSWDGAAASGENQDYDAASGEPCNETPEGYCEQALVHVNTAEPVAIEVSLADDPINDFDLYIYASDAAGSRGALIDQSANPQTLLEAVQVGNAQGYYLVQVVYFQTIESGYSATAEITGPGGGGGGGEADPLPETQFFFHGDVPVNQLDDATFDTTEPTGGTPDIAPGVNSLIGASWTGDIDAGRLDTLEVDFWQKSPVCEALLGEVNYEVTLEAADRTYEFPFFTEPASLPEIPARVIHTFTADDPESPLPIVLPGGPVTITITGHFIDCEAVTAIVYDSTGFPSGFSINVPPPVGRTPFPPDVDDPAGLQEVLASDPSQGWTSRSEMHVAQSPTDPNLLVAGSKFYNRDPDALAEYEFKIGSYVSFDGAQSWTDLGQVATCPPEQAPPESWPNNTCYPEDDPNQDGLDGGDQNTGRPSGDFGEEYITSDPWVQFDDEGNAYFMALDHPPFGGNPEGNGWGMTLHKWESVSADDIASGDPWSDRIPINTYPDSLRRDTLEFLDDKNTFAVNNAGPDGDGQTGIMIACWGQSIGALVKQQIVCERSTDGGESWPEEPKPISDVQQLVIGVHVVGDTQDPNTFYATWNQYATGGAAGDIGGSLTPETLEFAFTTDGGETWIHRQLPITTITGIPRQFPGQEFRNLSIPIMAVGPEGEIYITWSNYGPASDPDNDEDGMEADILLVKSTNGGLNWSAPTRVNVPDEAPNPNADQFQPYVAVNDDGQVNLIYFDRRLDPKTAEQSGNYFTDVFLARSNDGGATFTEHRLTHDATNPEHNAPVSTSGLFFGDYQGLVVDDCFAIPFVNDTHLANDELDPGPVRDPEFDAGMPESPYQEAVSWRVPNTSEFGGAPSEGCEEPPPPPPTCPGEDGEAGNHVVGTPGDDVLVGTDGKDVICGMGGNDVIRAKGGNDDISGGGGNDVIRGGPGRDDASGGSGDDTVRGGQGGDDLHGNAGDDGLFGQGASDEIDGGPGTDTCRGGGGADEIKGCER
ncbi:MAG TPA: hypothetical protein VHL78_07940 [Actinomycetota bacterium]|nr:hypothetical protein [Actinomycetota bacterium]